MRTARTLIATVLAAVALLASTPAGGPGAAQTGPDAADLSVGWLPALNMEPAPGTIRFIVQVRNLGPDDAPATVVRIALPDGVIALSGSFWHGGSPAGGTSAGACDAAPELDRLVCALGTVRAGDTASVAGSVANRGVPAGAAVQATVTASSDLPDPNPADDAGTVSLTFTGGPLSAGAADLRVVAVEDERWTPSVVAVAVRLENGQTVPAPGATLEATVPAGVGLVSRGGYVLSTVAADGGPLPACTTSTDGRTVRCQPAAPLRLDQHVELSLLVVNTGLAAGSGTELRVSAAWDGADAAPEDDVAVLPITFTGGPVALEGTDVGVAHDAAFPPGAQLPGTANAMVVITSTGPATPTDLQLLVDAPAGVRIASTISSVPTMTTVECVGLTATRLRCTFTQPPGQHQPQYVRVAAVNVGLPADSDSELRAVVRHGDPDPDAANDETVVPVHFPGPPVPTSPDGPNAELAVRAEPVRVYDLTRPVASFSWWITSRGPEAANGFVAEVRLGAGLTYRHAFGDSPLLPCSYDERTATVRCSTWRGSLPPASTTHLTVEAGFAGVAPGTPLEAVATVRSDLVDLDPADDEATARTTAPAVAPTIVTAAPATSAAPPTTAPNGPTGSAGSTAAPAALPATGARTARPLAVGLLIVLGGLTLAGLAGRAPRLSPRRGRDRPDGRR